MNKKSQSLIFIYGTLKREACNSSVMEEVKAGFVAEVTTVERYPLVISGLPYLLNQPGRGYHVKGELYDCQSFAIKRLDQFEGHPHLYKRMPVEVIDKAGNQVKVQAYFYQGKISGEFHKEYPVEKMEHE